MYVCKRGPLGTWTLEQKITASAPSALDRFGYAVSLDGDSLAISAPYHDAAGPANSGAVEVWTFAAGAGWTIQEVILPAGPQQWGIFGASLSLDGNTLAVGMHVYDGPSFGTDQGRVEVWERVGTDWTNPQQFSAGLAGTWDRFGSSVSLDGDTLAIGSSADSDGINVRTGSVEIWTRIAGIWTFQLKIDAHDPSYITTAGDAFGYSVSLAGDTLAIGRTATFDPSDVP